MKKHRLVLALPLALLTGMLAPSSGLAATTIGQAPPTTGAVAPVACGANSSHIQQKVDAAGGSYTVPAGGGVITRWQHLAPASTETLAMSLYRDADAVPGGTKYNVLAESAVETTTPNSLNTFETRIPVTGGELLGLRVVSQAVGCRYFTGDSDDTDSSTTPSPPVPSTNQEFGNAQNTFRLNVAAVIEPDLDGDGFGDETQDSCPSNPNAQDCVDPEVTIDKGPRKQSKKRTAKFIFSSNEVGATFECSLDGKAFAACSSPLTTKKLKRRKHVFSVHAIDKAGNRSADAVYKWKVKKKKR